MPSAWRRTGAGEIGSFEPRAESAVVAARRFERALEGEAGGGDAAAAALDQRDLHVAAAGRRGRIASSTGSTSAGKASSIAATNMSPLTPPIGSRTMAEAQRQASAPAYFGMT